MKQTQNKLAVFDIDGTLIDSARKVRQDVIDAFGRLGINGITHDEVLSVKSWYELLPKYSLDKKTFDEAFDRRKSWEQALKDGDAPLFEDTLPCLERLASAGVILSVLTRSLPEYTQAKLEHHGLKKYFEKRVKVTDIKAPSKEPEAHQLIKLVGRQNLEGAYFIGDRPEDVIVARLVNEKWNMNTAGIYVNREDKKIPKEMQIYYKVKTLAEVPKIIL